MSEMLSERGKALENEFFHRVDKNLLERIRQQEMQHVVRDQICGATGVSDPSLLEEFVQLGLRAESILALSLMPMVHVAWADGKVSAKERAAILQAAEQAGCTTGSPGHDLLTSWLSVDALEPTLFHAWKGYVHELQKGMSPDGRKALRKNLLDRASQVAKAAGGILGLASISVKERKALDEIAAIIDAPPAA